MKDKKKNTNKKYHICVHDIEMRPVRQRDQSSKNESNGSEQPRVPLLA